MLHAAVHHAGDTKRQEHARLRHAQHKGQQHKVWLTNLYFVGQTQYPPYRSVFCSVYLAYQRCCFNVQATINVNVSCTAAVALSDH
jgi:hypothetical protein